MTPTHDALRRHNQRITRMLADHECVGELLLVGIALARAVDLDNPPFGAGEKLSLSVFADRVYGNRRIRSGHIATCGCTAHTADERPRQRIRDVIRADIRRYRPTDSYDRVTCGRPMPQRDTGRCGRSPHHQHISRLTDPATGERTYVAACNYTAHKAWWAALRAENQRQLAETPAPVPPANTGGVLDRHLPEIDWWAIWSHLDPRWTPPPEGETWRKPTLTLLVEDEPDVPVVPAARPALTVVKGGWR